MPEVSASASTRTQGSPAFFTRGDKLLGEQGTEPRGGLDRPGARLTRCRDPQQPIPLPTIRVDAQFTDEPFSGPSVTSTRDPEALVYGPQSRHLWPQTRRDEGCVAHRDRSIRYSAECRLEVPEKPL